MIRLILVRHGNTFEAGETPRQVGACTDLPLTAQGRGQAERMAAFLQAHGIHPAAIYCGNLKRQRETAEIIAQKLNLEEKLHIDEPALTEIDYGLWENLTLEEILSQWATEYAEWTEASRWAEGIFGGSFEGHVRAIGAWLAQLLQTYREGETVVAVTSNGTLRFFCAQRQSDWEILAQKRLMEKLKVKTGHFCDLLLSPEALKILSWNTAP